MSSLTRFAVILMVGIGVCGCSGRAVDRVRDTNDLKAIGLAYHSHNDATKKAPAGAEDLARHLTEHPSAVEGLRSGRFVFIYGVSLQDLMAKGGTFEHVVGYHKDAPTMGGPVLFGDGSVRQLAPDEFQKAKKAG